MTEINNVFKALMAPAVVAVDIMVDVLVLLARTGIH